MPLGNLTQEECEIPQGLQLPEALEDGGRIENRCDSGDAGDDTR